MPDAQAGPAPAAATVDTEGINPPLGTAPGSPGTIIQTGRASVQDTTGTAVAGIGAAMPGGSVLDVIPWAGAGQAGSGTGQPPQSDYAVRPVTEGQYGFPQGAPDTAEVLGGPRGTAVVTPASPYPWLPSSTAFTGVLDTQAGGGSALISGLGTPPAYRAPSAGVAASVKDTSLTDIMGNQVTAMPLTSSAYSAFNVDTSYVGAPSAPVSLSTQVDTFTGTAASPTRYYASQQGAVPSSLVVRDTTSSQTLVSGTDYTVTSAGNGPKTSLYITFTHVVNWTAGDAVTLTYSYGTPAYFDSNLPAPASQSNVDTFALSELPVQLSSWSITTAANALTVFDVTQNVALVYNTDYTVSTVQGPYTPGGTYNEPVPATFAVTWKPTSATAKLGDTVTVTYNFTTSVPAAPGIGATTVYTDNLATITATPQALAHAGVVTPPGSVRVVDNQAGANFGKVLVLNVDYALTVTGTGATFNYSIARLAGSTNSALNDNVRVTYAAGSSAFFATGPVYSVDKGVFVPWAPPSGSVQVDYYLIQSSDLGTMYVPVSGQPEFYGQMSPSGGPSSGQPVYQTDTGTISTGTPFNLARTGVITPPEQLIVRDTTRVGQDPMQPTGTVLELNYDYTVTTTGQGPWKTYSITRLASSVNSVNGDAITVSYWYDQMGAFPLTQVADAITLVAGAAQLHNQDIATPASGLIVYDTTASKALAYGLDYTVSQVGTGPAQAMTITRVAGGPANVGATDALTVYYGYGVVLSAVFRQGLVPNQVPIYTPSGSQRATPTVGYQISIAAGNRAGLGPFSAWSDYVVPLNYSAPQPGAQGTTTAGTGTLDARNSINPIYRPDGSVKAGTGQGM